MKIRSGQAPKKITSSFPRRALYRNMNRNGQSPQRRRVVDDSTAAIQQMKDYCATHPESPSDVRRPQLFSRSDLWIALLGPSLEEGIVGIGPTVAAALRAFDAQYLVSLPQPIAAAVTVDPLRQRR